MYSSFHLKQEKFRNVDDKIRADENRIARSSVFPDIDADDDGDAGAGDADRDAALGSTRRSVAGEQISF